MKPKMITDPDCEVINMVNSCVGHRRQVAESREVLNRLSREQAQRRKKEWWRNLRQMVLEAGSCIALAGSVYVAMSQELIAGHLAIPIMVICLAYAGICVDRFVRR